MKKKTQCNAAIILISLLAILAILLSAACAPPATISLTLTMLPGTFTPLPPTPWPTGTPRPTATPDPNIVVTSTQLPGTAEACPPFALDDSVPSNIEPQAFIGRHFDDQHLPAGMTPMSTKLLGSDVYAYTKTSLRGQALFLVQKLTCRDTKGRAYYEVTDALLLPRLDTAKNEVVTQLCFQGSPSTSKQPLAAVLAYGTYDPAQPTAQLGEASGWVMNIKRAWQVKQRFFPLDPKSLTCLFN